jgi:hypothetical protein
MPNVRAIYWAGFASQKITSAVMLSGTITITMPSAHGFLTGQKVVMTGANQDYFNGTFVITATGANTFTYTATGANATATGDIIANFIPEDIKAAIKQIVAWLWADRGDCSTGAGGTFASVDLTEQKIPPSALGIMRIYRIKEL